MYIHIKPKCFQSAKLVNYSNVLVLGTTTICGYVRNSKTHLHLKKKWFRIITFKSHHIFSLLYLYGLYIYVIQVDIVSSMLKNKVHRFRIGQYGSIWFSGITQRSTFERATNTGVQFERNIPSNHRFRGIQIKGRQWRGHLTQVDWRRLYDGSGWFWWWKDRKRKCLYTHTLTLFIPAFVCMAGLHTQAKWKYIGQVKRNLNAQLSPRHKANCSETKVMCGSGGVKAERDNSEKTRTANKMARAAYSDASHSARRYVRMSAACGLGVWIILCLEVGNSNKTSQEAIGNGPRQWGFQLEIHFWANRTPQQKWLKRAIYKFSFRSSHISFPLLLRRLCPCPCAC